jgi:hypothetical protein
MSDRVSASMGYNSALATTPRMGARTGPPRIVCTTAVGAGLYMAERIPYADDAGYFGRTTAN